MADSTVRVDDLAVYSAPKILASYEAGEILAEAETGSVVIIVS